MQNYLNSISFLVVTVGIINLLRISLFLIGSDFYGLVAHIKKRKKARSPSCMFSVVIPAFNELESILRCVSSVLDQDYPQELLEIIVVDDGSTDGTLKILNTFKNSQNIKNLQIITQSNSGKAHALNNGMKYHSNGTLLMCLDADSYLAKDAVRKTVIHFENQKLMALASNTKISPSKGFLNKIQQFEYLIGYQMKKALTFFNIEYIIGGVGSTFRKSFLEKINYYDTDTVTEDIDLTMKILQFGNKNVKVAFGADVITFTQSVLTLKELIKQRFRWKWGRYQTFFKNRNVFFSKDKRFTKRFSWIYLPYALTADILFSLEPIMILYMVYITIRFHDIFTFISAFTVVSVYIGINILADDTTPSRDKPKLLIIAPYMYFLFYVLSFIEYIVLIKSFILLPKLVSSISPDKSTWKPVKRLGYEYQ